MLRNITKLEIPCECPRILVADDEPFNIIALEGILQQYNVSSIDRAFNGQEALQKFERNLSGGSVSCGSRHVPYKLFLLDKNMPVLDGIDCAIRIREIL